MDGVLVDSARAHKESWQTVGRERGRPISDAEFDATFGRSSKDIIRILFGASISDEEAKRIDDRKEALYRELVRGRVPIMPGAVELVRSLAGAGFKIGIGSSGPPENIALVVDALGIGGELSGIATGMDVTRGKPDPQVFQIAAERMGIEAQQAIVVEDAPAGIEAARRAGMKSVALASSHPREALLQADLIVGALEELTPEVLRALLAP